MNKGEEAKKFPPKGFGTPHIYWTVASSGYEQEGQKQAERTRKVFVKDKMLLERAPNACFGEIPADVKGQYLIDIPPEKVPTHIDHTESSMKQTVMSVPDLTKEKCRQIDERIRTDQLKLRRDIVKKQLRELEFEMSAGKAGYESNSREVGMRPMIQDQTGRIHGSLKRRPYVSTEIIGTTTPNEFNEFYGTGLKEPDWGKYDLKSTLQNYPQFRSKSQLPRIPGVGFA